MKLSWYDRSGFTGQDSAEAGELVPVPDGTLYVRMDHGDVAAPGAVVTP